MNQRKRLWPTMTLSVLVAVASATGQTTLPTGEDLFEPPVALTGKLAHNFHHPVAVDWNGDRAYDLLVAHHVEGWARACIYLNAGTNSQPSFSARPIGFLTAKGETWAVFCGCRLSGSSLLQIVDWNQDGKFDILANGSVGDLRLLLNTSSDPRAPVFDEVISTPVFWLGKGRYSMVGYWDDDDVLDYGLTITKQGFQLWKGIRQDGEMRFSKDPFYKSPNLTDKLYIGGRSAVAWDWRGDGYQPGKVEFIAAGPEANKERELLLMEFDPADPDEPLKPLMSIMPIPTEPSRRFAVAVSACDFNRDGCMDLLVGYAGKYQQIDILYGKVHNAHTPPPPKVATGGEDRPTPPSAGR